MTYEEQLKPCPWCGNKVKWNSADHTITIECKQCHYHRWFEPLVGFKKGIPIGNGMFYNAKAQEEAVEAWNTRHEENERESDTEHSK